MPIIFDLDHESGPAEIKTDALSAAEMIERDPARYARELPKGKTLGPRSGLDRIMLG
jgi:hypothetical protein